MAQLRSYFPWKLWVPAVALVTVLALVTGVDLYQRMHRQMVEIAEQVTSVAVGQLGSILGSAGQLLETVGEQLKERPDYPTLAARPAAMLQALQEVDRTLHGTGFDDLVALAADGTVLAYPRRPDAAGRPLINALLLQPVRNAAGPVLLGPSDNPVTGESSAPLLLRMPGDQGGGEGAEGKDAGFMLMTSIDMAFLDTFQSRLRSSLVRHVALFDKSDRLLVGSWPFGEQRAATVSVRNALPGFDLVAAAGFHQREVLGNVLSELVLLTLTYLAAILAITALAFAYAFRHQVGQALRELVAQRELLHREAQHRIGGALQLISSLVSLQARAARDERVRPALEAIRHRLAAVIAVNGKLGGRIEGGEVELADYLGSVCRDLAISYERDEPEIRLATDLASLACDAEKAMRLGLMVSELVTNAFRHAFPDDRPGRITVALAHDQETFTVTVADDGSGLAEGDAKGGMGLELVPLLAAQLGWTLARPASEQGVTWTITGDVASLRTQLRALG